MSVAFSQKRCSPWKARYNISEEQLQYFIDFGFRAKEMAAMLGVHD